MRWDIFTHFPWSRPWESVAFLPSGLVDGRCLAVPWEIPFLSRFSYRDFRNRRRKECVPPKFSVVPPISFLDVAE